MGLFFGRSAAHPAVRATRGVFSRAAVPVRGALRELIA
jgi:hypothetical protein